VEIKGEYSLDHPRERVWPLLLDADVLARIMPGCESLRLVAEDEYEMTMSIGIAAVRGKYNGKVWIKEKNPPEHMALVVDGNGGLGFVKAQVALDLRAGSNTTLLAYQAEAEVGGPIASVGHRMLGGVAKLLVNQALKSLKAELDGQRA